MPNPDILTPHEADPPAWAYTDDEAHEIFKGMPPPKAIREQPGRGSRLSPYPPRSPKRQDVAERAQYLLTTYGPSDMLRLHDNLMAGKVPRECLSSFDALVVAQIARGLRNDGQERERLWDRMYGKVPDKVVNLNANVEIDADALSEQAAELLARLTG
jgi:hypothetical protein